MLQKDGKQKGISHSPQISFVNLNFYCILLHLSHSRSTVHLRPVEPLRGRALVEADPYLGAPNHRVVARGGLKMIEHGNSHNMHFKYTLMSNSPAAAAGRRGNRGRQPRFRCRLEKRRVDEHEMPHHVK